MEKNNYRIGIVGGMGPMAGVILQKLIIDHTPASKDQDHIQVVCFTNSQIPDRTASLKNDNGAAFSRAIIESVRLLEKVGVDCIAIPCNTAHARFDSIQAATELPVVNMIENTLEILHREGVSRYGILATHGTVASRVFEEDSDFEVMLPDSKMQQEIMDVIYAIKAGSYNDSTITSKLQYFIETLKKKGAQKVILACTELSLYSQMLNDKDVIDPLAQLAKQLVAMALESGLIKVPA
jgi:aspartate racemase